MLSFIQFIHKIVWGPWLMFFFLAAGIFFTVRSGFFQFKGIAVWWRGTIGELTSRSEKSREQLKTACTALAATVGTGNIVGVVTAILAGGPGAVFWMWISAALGMMTAYAEVYLGISGRYKNQQGEWVCGPFVYLSKAANCPKLAWIYALLCLLASLGMGSMVQANSLADCASYSFGLSKSWIALVLCGLVFLVIRGGGKLIGAVSAKLIPLAALLYMGAALVLLFLCRGSLIPVIQSIFSEAFSFRSVAGGTGGYAISTAMRYGLARGVFSNEAGLGSLAVLHGSAPADESPNEPQRQGMWAMFEVFFDTIVVCTITALAVLCVLAEKKMKTGPGMLTGSGLNAASLTSWCFSEYMGNIGGYIISVALVLFAFATIIAWFYLGHQALVYLQGGRRPAPKGLYFFLYLAAVFAGCLVSMELVWQTSDIINGLMALPNLMALVLLAKTVKFP